MNTHTKAAKGPDQFPRVTEGQGIGAVMTTDMVEKDRPVRLIEAGRADH
ncbi:hypothetical protein [Streptomyces sp. NPDC056689]